MCVHVFCLFIRQQNSSSPFVLCNTLLLHRGQPTSSASGKHGNASWLSENGLRRNDMGRFSLWCCRGATTVWRPWFAMGGGTLRSTASFSIRSHDPKYKFVLGSKNQ